MRFLLFFSGLIFSIGAGAHTPYLVPLSFEPVAGDRVSLDASFAEKFFVAEAAFNNDGYAVIGPDGESVEPEEKVELKTRVVLEHKLTDEGTYRFVTGARYGAVFRTYELDGERRSIRDPEQPLPEGAVLVDHFQSVTWAETYVSKGGPTDTVLAATEVGLEIEPQTHPNNLFAKEEFRFRVLFQGLPMTDFELFVYQARDQFGDDSDKVALTTNAQGQATFVPQEQGVYLVFARHRAAAPKGAEAPKYSYTTTLSLEAY